MFRTRLIAAGLLVASTLTSATASAARFTGLVVLGDSYSDQGNLFIASATLQPRTGQPVQPALDHYFLGRFANGPVYADFLALGLGTISFPSLVGGGNFAFGGALNASNTVEAPPFGTGAYAHDAYPWSLQGERQAFAARAVAHGADPHALYVVFSGANDVAAILQQGQNPATAISSTVAGIIQAIDTLKAAGARTVLVPNVPDEGLLPVVTALAPVVPGISAAATQLTASYNSALQTALDQETGITIVRFDTFRLLQRVVANPAAFGFSNATQACYNGTVLPDPGATVCKNPDGYVFWDTEHFTTRFHAVLARELLKVLGSAGYRSSAP